MTEPSYLAAVRESYDRVADYVTLVKPPDAMDPSEYLPVVFAEFHRTLDPGGHLLLAAYVGDDEHLRPVRAYGGRKPASRPGKPE